MGHRIRHPLIRDCPSVNAISGTIRSHPFVQALWALLEMIAARKVALPQPDPGRS